MRIRSPCKYLISEATGPKATVIFHEDPFIFKYSNYFFCVLLKSSEKFNSIVLGLRSFYIGEFNNCLYFKCLRRSSPRLTLPNNAYATFRNYYKHSKKQIRCGHDVQRKKKIQVFAEETKSLVVQLWAFPFQQALRIAQPISFTNISEAL